jgi:hypothetical protein
MNTSADYEILYLILLLLPLVTASIIWLLDRFSLIPDASADARMHSLELLLHKEIADRTEVCGQLGLATKQIIEFLKHKNVEIQPAPCTDIKQQNAQSDSAANTQSNPARKNSEKPSKIKGKAKAKKRGAPRGNVTPFPHKNVQKKNISDDNANA